MLKYPLLLQQICSTTPPGHPDYANLRSALEEIQQVADKINELKKRKDLVEQIVAGKGSKGAQRTASQKVQHSATKKIKRRQEKLKNAVIGPGAHIGSSGDSYAPLAAQVAGLEVRVQDFARQCLDWSIAVKDSYDCQIRLMEQWKLAYRSGEIGEPGVEERLDALIESLRGSIIGSWQLMDGDIRTTVIPMTHRLYQLFDNPKAVMAKRDMRKLDYSRYRSVLAKTDKAPERKVIESANGFVALHAQLLDELPQFIYGIQTLLDVCVQAFARIQAAHFLHVKRTLVAYWQEHSWLPAGGDVVVDENTQEGSMRHLNVVREFWTAHQEVAQYAESLYICQRKPDESRPDRARSQSHPLTPAGESTPSSVTSEEMPRKAGIPTSRSASGGISHGPRSAMMRMDSFGSMGKRMPSGAAAAAAAAVAEREREASSNGAALLQPEATVVSREGTAPGIVRSLSGPLSAASSKVSLALFKDAREETPPPATPPQLYTPLSTPDTSATKDGGAGTGAPGKRMSVPTLPPISCIDFDEEFGFLIQPGSTTGLPFLDDPHHPSGVQRELIDLPRSISGRPDANGNGVGDGTQGTPSSDADAGANSFPGQVHFSSTRTHQLETPERATAHRRYKVLATLAAVDDHPSSAERAAAANRMGWPLVSFAAGDLLKVLYDDPEDGTGLLFGRTEKGQLGWAEKSYFVKLE